MFNYIIHLLKRFICRESDLYISLYNDISTGVMVINRSSDEWNILHRNKTTDNIFCVDNNKDLKESFLNKNSFEQSNFISNSLIKCENNGFYYGSSIYKKGKEYKKLSFRFKYTNKKGKDFIVVSITDTTKQFDRIQQLYDRYIIDIQNNAISQFASSFSHIFFNKFTPIVYYIKKILNTDGLSESVSNPDKLKGVVIKRLGILDKNKKNILKNLDELRDLSLSVKTASTGHFVSPFKSFSVSKIIEDIIQSYMEIPDNSSVKLTTYMMEDVHLYGALNRFQDAFTNIFRNGIRFSKETETFCPEMTIKTYIENIEYDEIRKTDVEHLSEKEETKIVQIKKSFVISIIDNGPGILPSMTEKIFDLGTTTKEVTEGSGFGLTFARRDIKSFGGIVKCDCKYDTPKRTRFRIMIPMENIKNSMDSKKKIDDIKKPSYNKIDVLIINDNVQDMFLLKNELGMSGKNCMVAQTFNRITKILKNTYPSFLVIGTVKDKSVKELLKWIFENDKCYMDIVILGDEYRDKDDRKELYKLIDPSKIFFYDIILVDKLSKFLINRLKG